MPAHQLPPPPRPVSAVISLRRFSTRAKDSASTLAPGKGVVPGAGSSAARGDGSSSATAELGCLLRGGDRNLGRLRDGGVRRRRFRGQRRWFRDRWCRCKCQLGSGSGHRWLSWLRDVGVRRRRFRGQEGWFVARDRWCGCQRGGGCGRRCLGWLWDVGLGSDTVVPDEAFIQCRGLGQQVAALFDCTPLGRDTLQRIVKRSACFGFLLLACGFT